jgi:alkylated DNA repair dioxygenase AlkB
MQVIRRIANHAEVKDYVKRLLEIHGQPEQAKCARNRANFWLKAEPVYSTKTYVKAVEDDRLWTFIRRHCPEANLAQVFGGNVAIDWHRDAAFAESQAWLFSLGKSTFQTKTRDGEIKSLDLESGDLVKFDCKLLHRANNVQADRIGIGIWQAKLPILF